MQGLIYIACGVSGGTGYFLGTLTQAFNVNGYDITEIPGKFKPYLE